ncbi:MULTISPECIES: ABC-F family ATP-binding cassette domain-containing protein [Mammaliicoccus]|uniref:ABC-F family ATP-binding cassette domain-containing protein n=1 Tax=Mammaliicoccus fleurettii TaxID=150056 RepID=A0ABS5MN84_9STAP|nr:MULTISPECIES: ABC-F family ATP-binding cassette domain-containing protein [Mammaliicoccus]MBL0847532.1 ABC-F family ATP-binding cassette domain-containing protein [Mammaliicoccus fleurettii]MBO3061975.1 ABC-F family ATP-binding cassette domain-containing protein [Mammaliicoccus fleurettii]MBS3672495.1 ABC-F family ATP-binding cassette domain-containing protein [Mammaliicoccus fleurettii]MBS3697364.1 ABC-F family ATP-binding cassette domain-containing protein [Mammaliicoccus fleurettii]MEB77
MILLQINNLEKSFDGDVIFSDADFEVKTGERIAIVGRNGAGKTTLMKIIAGVESYDSGNMSKGKQVSMGYLTQQMTLDSNDTVMNEMKKPFEHVIVIEEKMKSLTDWLSKHADDYDSDTYQEKLSQYETLSNQYESLDGYQYESKIKTVLTGLNFIESDFDRQIQSFSGGQKTRLSMAQMLLSEPDLLLLDEPTNHLDMDTTEWLENYLTHFKGAIVIISHDRYFLDKIVNQVYDVALGSVKKYVGNYSKFLKERDAHYEKVMAEYERQQSEIKKLETFVEKNITRASTSGMAKSRRKVLERMERIDKPRLDAKSAQINFEINRATGEDVLKINNLEIGYSESITSPINLEVKRHDRIAIIGPNGIGKSTLIKTIAQKLPALAGDVLFGSNIQIGYYDQKQAEFKSNMTILDYVWNQYSHMLEKDIRTILGRFLFTQDEVKKVINDLSGGEKARLQLALLMLEKNNVLILDEPTNHLDIDSKEMLEQALQNYEGTLLFVSHDRYFINELANKVFHITYEGNELFQGDYQYYLEKLEQRDAINSYEQNDSSSTQTTKDDNFYTNQKQHKKEKRKLERQLEEIENNISTYEEQITNYEHQLTLPEIFNDIEKSNEINNLRIETERLLEENMEKWEEIESKLN